MNPVRPCGQSPGPASAAKLTSLRAGIEGEKLTITNITPRLKECRASIEKSPMTAGLRLRRYTDIFVGQPQVEEDYITSSITPQQCRLRDMTYSAPISVNVEYTRGKEIVVRQGKDGAGAVNIGRIPLMLRCDRWAF